MFRLISKVSPVCQVSVASSSSKLACKNATRFSGTVPLRPDFPTELLTPEIEKSISLDTASSKELCKHKIGLAVKKFQSHKSDTGSASVQIAAMTEKILNLTRHFAEHKQDKHGNRGFQMLLSKRRSMMQYLMRKDIVEFGRVVESLKLVKEASQLRARK